MFIERVELLQHRRSMRTLCNLETGLFVTIKQLLGGYSQIWLGNMSKDSFDYGISLTKNALTDNEALQLYEEIKAGWVNGRQVMVVNA